MTGQPDHPEPSVDFREVSIENFAHHMLFGEVDVESMRRACEFILKGNQMFDGQEPLTLMINSTGGHVFDGFALIDLMELSTIPVKTVGLGSIMSMGLLIFAAGHQRILTRNTVVMSHQFAGGSIGKYHELMADVKPNLYMKHMFVQHFKRHTKLTEKKINEILFGPSDVYLTPKECLKYGICDHIVDELPEIKIVNPTYEVVPTAPAIPKTKAGPKPAKEEVGE